MKESEEDKIVSNCIVDEFEIKTRQSYTNTIKSIKLTKKPVWVVSGVLKELKMD